jgi:hypothetical protein
VHPDLTAGYAFPKAMSQNQTVQRQLGYCKGSKQLNVSPPEGKKNDFPTHLASKVEAATYFLY